MEEIRKRNEISSRALKNMHISRPSEDEKKDKTMFTAIAHSNGYDVIYPSKSLSEFNREVIARRSELPRMWEELKISFRRYYAYLSDTKTHGLELINRLYVDIFDNSDRGKLYEDRRTQMLRLNRDPDHLFELYYEFFPDPAEVDLSDVVEDVLRAHYTAALAAHRTIRYKEHFSEKQIHPLVVKVLKQSYIEFWVKPEDDSECFSDSHYSASRRQEETLPWQDELPELDDFSNDRAWGDDPHPEDWC